MKTSKHLFRLNRGHFFQNDAFRSHGTTAKNELRYSATLKWVNSIVIKEKLCPFAPPVRQASKLRVSLSNASSHDDIIRDIAVEAHLLVGDQPHSHIDNDSPPPETTLVVLDDDACSSLKNFHDLVRLSWRVQEEAINKHGYTKHLQLVLFHPKATHDTYTEQDGEDAADYTIRSPFPVIHLLREVDVMDAVTSGYKDLEGLPSRNKARMRQRGIEKCAAKLEACHKL